ncbi:MAG: TauD/TfdA family dioxygenase [Novosphingobium sp.]|nr:TauD/TfdA family dioxygenase [Novosphingobium sp.]
MGEITVTPLTTTIGARVDGVDLTQPLDEADAQQLRDALTEHAVITFSGQQMDREQQRAFTGIFGELRNILSHRLVGNHDTMVVLDNRLWQTAASAQLPSRANFSDEFKGWHTDSTYCPEIAWVTTLRGELLPPVGGGTNWMSMAAAFDALSPAMQGWLETLTAVHASPRGQREVLRVDEQPEDVREEWDRELTARTHPVVIVHPISGRKVLFVNAAYTIKIQELSSAESANLLRFLWGHCDHPDFIVRHRWSEGDIVVWDQLQTMHMAPSDYLPHERRVVRMTAGLVKPMSVAEYEAQQRQPEKLVAAR